MSIVEINSNGFTAIKMPVTDRDLHRSPKLDMMLGHRVKIEFKDGDKMTGVLEYGTDLCRPKAYKIVREDGGYDTVFYKSHVKRIVEEEE